jgi:alpha-N-arabinofuranosidase
VNSPAYANERFDHVPLLEAIAPIDDDAGTVTIFAVNRSQDGPLMMEANLHGMPGLRVTEHIVLESPDPHATNTADNPDRVVPHTNGSAKADNATLVAELPTLSWNVIRLTRSNR